VQNQNIEGLQTPPSSNVDAVANLLGAKSFDVATHRVDDFRQKAQREAAREIIFNLGKPANTSQGAAVLTNPTSQITANLVVRRLGASTKFAPPTVEFAEPELQSFLEQVHLIPMVDVTGPQPAGFLFPLRITGWDGYATIYNGLTKLEKGQGLFLKYLRGGGGDPGGYQVEPFTLEERHREIMAHVDWPTPKDIVHYLPTIPFSDLLKENFNLNRAWQKVLSRKAGA
jgi:hypothetical protein